jgi:SdrD B-like domain/PEP-CTERM motif
MAKLHKPPISACAKVARCSLGCLTITLLFAAFANGETISASSYNSWQWNGFSRSALASTSSSSSMSLLSSVLSSLSSFDSIVSESTVESPTTPPVTDAATLSGVVYYDANDNGVRDSTDWGIRDAIVTLTSESNSSTVVTTVTDAQGAYSFKNLPADNYTVTLMTPSTSPGQPSVGTLTDASGNFVFTGQGHAILGQDSVTDIQLNAGYTGNTYDFGQLAYPTDLLSKRSLLNENPGVPNTKAAPTPPTPPPPVPEPGTLALLVVAGLSAAGFARRRRK